MRQFVQLLFATVVLLSVAQRSEAQYYSWGADRASLRWSRLSGDRVEVLYPDSVEQTARRMLHYIDAVQGDISYGFTYPALDIPFVVHPENFYSNGMVMWAPLRVEFLSSPAVDSYSQPWVKQLVAHEYRHAVQYNNLNQSTLRWASYILGQQGAAASLLFPPLYALEGDAVLCETQMSTFGRGLQPSFSIGYRAAADSDELLDQRDYLKWRCGSFLCYTPDHYRMGYQMITYANNRYGENILNKSFEYIARNPQFISPFSIALNKFYDTSAKGLFYDTFTSLSELWQSMPRLENSAQIISAPQPRNYTTYSNPMELECGDIVALKSDYKEPSRFVRLSEDGANERLVAHTGSVSTRAAYAAGRLWWTEYRRSALFAEDINSQLCYMDLERGGTKSLSGHKNALYATPIDNSANHIAYVEYAPMGQYTVVELIDERVVSRTDVTYPNEVHGMAWDDLTQRLYLIVTGDEGMWIEQQCDDGFEPLTRPSYITLSSLSAANGYLYFGSIASGRDEVHSLEIASLVERQLSESTYGSFDPHVGQRNLLLTTYNRLGYQLSVQSTDKVIREVEYAPLPQNILNQPLPQCDIVNLDTVSFDEAALLQSEAHNAAKRYRKGLHLINVHSWAPIRFNPLTLLDEQSLDIGIGATLVSQNLLSSCESYLSYGWDQAQGSVVTAGANYNGLGVTFDVSATYGGDQNLYMISSISGELKTHSAVSVVASLPLFYNRGYHNHSLSSYVGWSYSNGIVPTGLGVDYAFDPSSNSFQTYFTCEDIMEGLHKLIAGVSYTNYVQSAYRDLTTPWGYTLSANYAVNPTNSDFSQLASFYAKLYTPGVAQNNSFTIAAAFQDAFGGFEYGGYSPLSYLSTALLPRGYLYTDISNNNYLAASAEYKFPLCHPEWSLHRLLFVKRLSLAAGFDYASFNTYLSPRTEIYSYGGSVIADLNAISMSSSSTLQLTFSLYKPLDKDLYFSFGLSLPF